MKKILSVLVCVCLLLSAMVITASAADTEIVFEFGANGSASHFDGNDIGTSKTYTEGAYTLKLTDAYKCYDGARDATGTSALKMGTGSIDGKFTITVPDSVTSVIFKVAQYKNNAAKITINGAEHTINTASNNGEYTPITVDTTSTKTITFVATGSKHRCMIDSITYVIAGDTQACTHAATSTEPNGDETHKVVCDDCSETVNAAVDCEDANLDGKCDTCDGAVALPEEKTIAEVFAMADGDTKFYVTAEIVETYGNSWAKYGNFKLKDDSTEDTIIMYGLNDENGNLYESMTEKPVVGDTIKVLANRSSYNGVGQLANAVLIEILPATTPSCEHTNTSTTPNGDETHKVVCGDCGETTAEAVDCVDADTNGKCDTCGGDVAVSVQDPEADSTLTIEEALALGETKEHNVYTEGKYYVSGKIVSVYDKQYGNMYIEDEAGNMLTVYGTYDATGENRYGAMENAPVAGDTVKLYGVIGKYNTTPQMKNAWIVEVIPGEGEPENNDPAADSVLSVEDAIALGASKLHNVFTENKYYVTGTITEVYETTYGNMKITDEAGNILTIYGSYDADGTNRYDAMENAPQVGDTVKLYGIIGQYNGTAQMKNAWIIEIVADDTNDDTTGDDTTTDGDNTTGGTTGDDTTGGTTTDKDNANTDDSTTSPDTGDNMGAVVALAMVAGAALVFVNKKR